MSEENYNLKAIILNAEKINELKSELIRVVDQNIIMVENMKKIADSLQLLTKRMEDVERNCDKDRK